MILGLGIDIVEIDRIKKSVEEFGDKFLERIFTQTELEYSLSKKNKYQHLAARFAAKEAVIKALSSFNKTINLKDIEVYNQINGIPIVKIYGEANSILGDDKVLNISLSHTEKYATCVAILSQKLSL